MKVFWITLVITFWAEMGDKTQLVALAYATRYRLRDVLLGITVGTALVHLVSVALGRFIASWVPLGYIQALSAASFFGFAIWTYRGDDAASEVRESKHHPAILIGVAFFLAELGDKTMLASVALATQWPWLPVWLGTTAGMVLSDGLAVGVGRLLGREIPARILKWIAIVLFVGFGLWSAAQAYRSFHPVEVVVGLPYESSLTVFPAV